MSITMQGGGELAATTLQAHGVDTVFTLSGGHLFPLYDGCVKHEITLIDTRHEQTAAFAAEGWAKVTRRVGVAALTAGPGVTNGVSAITSAHLNGSPVTIVGGRAPQGRWGSGSLQELDHVPIVSSITKHAPTIATPDAIAAGLGEALQVAGTAHRGPTFVDVPIDCWGPASGPGAVPGAPRESGAAMPDPDDVACVAGMLGKAERPVLMVGGDVYWAGAEEALCALVDALGLPVFFNDL